jgi:uncharacterized membrane protein YqjE
VQPNLVGSAKHLAIGVIRHASSRLQLLGIEIAEERERVIALLVTALMSCFFVSLAVVFGALVLIAAYWDTPHRVAVIGWLAVIALVIAVLGVMYFLYRLRAPVALFAHSLAEFERDREALESVE